MTIWQKIIVGALTGILWLAAVVAKHFFADIDIGLFVASCAGVIGALGIHGMATGGSGSAQGGFASVRLLAVIAAIALGLSLLGGCAAVKGYEAIAQDGVKQANDNALQVWAVAGCAMPYSAILRNPQVIPALQTLCTSGQGDPTKLLAPAAAASGAK
jgi:hypothetical protein